MNKPVLKGLNFMNYFTDSDDFVSGAAVYIGSEDDEGSEYIEFII